MCVGTCVFTQQENVLFVKCALSKKAFCAISQMPDTFYLITILCDIY